MQEHELIARLREGDSRAFMEAVDLHKDRIFNTALGFVQNMEDAEEITQEVFIKLHNHIQNFRGDAQLGTWLYRVTVSHSIDFLRGKKRRLSAIFGFANTRGGGAKSEFHHPGIAAERKEDAALLFSQIRALPENQQTAFVLQKVEGLTLQQVADVMETSVSAVESLLHRAKAQLRKKLEIHYKNLSR